MKYDEAAAIEKARNNMVTYDNQLIQNVARRKYALTLIEQKEIAYIVSLIKPDDEKYQYTFNVSDFCRVTGIDDQSGRNYENVKAALQRLHDNSFWITDGKREKLLSWISEAEIVKGTGTVNIEISKNMMPYLFNLKSRFTAHELYQILALSSSYSVAFYEVFKSYSFVGKKIFDTEELKRLVSCPYTDYKNFRRYALEPAIKEINKFTDIDVCWFPVMKGRKAVQITAVITRKDKSESVEAYRKTMAELNGIKDRQSGQINLFEFMGDGSAEE